MCSSASVSLKARPRSSGAFWRIDAGSVSLIKPPRLVAPTVSSIAAISRGEGPMWRSTKVVAGSAASLRCAVITCSLNGLGHAPRRRGIQYTSAAVIGSRCRGVLDRPLSRTMTAWLWGLPSSRRMRLVGGFIHQAAKFVSIRDSELEEPRASAGIRIDQRGFARNSVVHLEHLARDRRVDVRRRLDRFHHGGGLRLLQGPPDLGQFDEDDVAKLRLRVVGDADGRDIAFDAQPLMVGGEQ